MFRPLGKFHRAPAVDSRLVWRGHQWLRTARTGTNPARAYLTVLSARDLLRMLHHLSSVEETWLPWYFSLTFEYNIVILHTTKPFLKKAPQLFHLYAIKHRISCLLSKCTSKNWYNVLN